MTLDPTLDHDWNVSFYGGNITIIVTTCADSAELARQNAVEDLEGAGINPHLFRGGDIEYLDGGVL